MYDGFDAKLAIDKARKVCDLGGATDDHLKSLRVQLRYWLYDVEQELANREIKILYAKKYPR